MNNLKIMETALKEGVPLEDKVYLFRLYAELMTNHTDGLYDASSYEVRLINSLSSLVNDIPLNAQPQLGTCHVISSAYLEGGHTRLCENLASMHEKKLDICITRKTTVKILNRLENYFSNIYSIHSEDVEILLKKTIIRLSQYKQLILHIHPDDIVTVAAIGLIKSKINVKVYFVNHADHVFSFGRSIIDTMLMISFRGYEIENTIKAKAYNYSFVGIPINTSREPSFKSETKNIFIAGSSYKMKPNKNISIQKEISNYLKNNHAVNLVVVGIKYSDYWWWAVKLKYYNRVSLNASLGYQDYLSLLENCDSCIDTAPTTGGTAFAEMYLNGLKPLAIYSGIYGYTPLDSIRGNNLMESENKFLKLSNAIFPDLMDVHGYCSVKKRYLGSLNNKFYDIPKSLKGNRNDLSLYETSDKVIVSRKVLVKVLISRYISLGDKLKLLIHRISISGFVVLYLNKLASIISKRIKRALI